MNRYLVVDGQDRVQNVIVWDGVSPYAPNDGCRLISCDEVGRNVWIGWQLVDGEWIAPPVAPVASEETLPE